jgi:hypothetical protein
MPNQYNLLNNSIGHIGKTLLTSQLETNLKGYLDWGLLNIGGFTNIARPTSGSYGGDFSTLRLVNDPSYTLGQVWETARKDWVYESGLSYSYQPIDISGVYVNGVYYSSGSLPHHYNYPLGRVIFDTALPSTSGVSMNYSYKNVQIYIADQAPWWDELQYNSFRIDDSSFSKANSGNWAILSNHRVQLPAVVVEASAKRSFQPYEMGQTNQRVFQDVLYHVIAESRWWRNQLMDIICLDKDRTIFLYDNNLVSANNAYPLDYRGAKNSLGKLYPTLIEDYPYTVANFKNMTVQEMTSYNSRLYKATIRTTFEVIVG